MKSIDDNIETLSRAILNEAHSDAEHVVQEAKAQAEAIRRRGLADAEAERKRILDKAGQEVERVRSQAVANARLKARSIQFQRREKMLDKVFTAARGKIASVQSWSNYEEIAVRLLKEALQQLNSPQARVHLDARTAQVLTKKLVADIAGEMKVELEMGKPLEKGSGVVVESTDGRLQFDNTLENRLNRLQNNLRSPVYHLLSGEKL
jgi:vacuolar-type H+-ATPase subunit E/Vma4